MDVASKLCMILLMALIAYFVFVAVGVDALESLFAHKGLWVPAEEALDYEVSIMWRERLTDTFFQVVVIAASLLGVLALILGGRRPHE